MHIAIVAHSAVGGSVYFAVTLARRLAANGHRIWFVSPRNQPYAALLAATPGCDVVEVPPPLSSEEDGIPEDASPFITRMLELHAAVRLDVINVHYTVPYLAYLVPIREELGVPLVGTFHGTDLFPSDDMVPLQQAVLALARQADALTVVCRSGLEVIGQEHHYIPNFSLDPAPADPPPRKPRRLLHMSNFRPVKNVPFLIEGFAAFAARYPELGDVTLDLLGEGPEKAQVRRQIAQHGLESRVTLLPKELDREKLMHRVASAGVVVLTSHRECCPLVFLEAMTCGTLCLGARVGGIPDLLEDGRGVLYDPDHIDSFVAGLHACVADLPAARAMANRGHTFVTTELTPDAIAARYEAVYAAVAGREPVRQ